LENTDYLDFVMEGLQRMFCKMKKLLILLPLLTALLFTSCSNIRSLQLSALTNEEGKKIQQMSQEIIRCFTKKDKEALKKLFCEQIRNQPGFDGEIDKAFKYFTCDVYIASQANDSAGGGESLESGRRTDWYVSPDIPYIKVIFDKDGDDSTPMESRYYSMYYYWNIVNDKDKSLEGLQFITIELLNVDSMTLGKK
jgi:hypothetical protein